MTAYHLVNLPGWFVRDISEIHSKSVSESVSKSVSESVSESVSKNISKSVFKSVTSIQACSKTSLSTLCAITIGPGVPLHCAAVICRTELRNQTTCAVNLMLAAETASILQA